MAAQESSPFARLSYPRLADVHEQWPIVGRGDVYYGGTTYENKHGLGVQLFTAAQQGRTVRLPRVRRPASLRPKEKQLLAVPITRLYDRARTVSSAPLLGKRIGEPYVTLHPTAAERFGLTDGQHVMIGLDGTNEQVLLKVDPSVAAGVALVPRSMGLPIRAPTPIRLKIPAKDAAR
jgi:NADH-quinone oxidoreductase subunit G